MGDIGYTNNKESMAGIKANYDSLDDYIDSLRCAINTPFDEYEEIGVKVDDEYRQLNANILQIENEYYSTVRPKQLLNNSEMPINALKQRGIRYIEIRSIDVNAFDPLGINEEQLYFLEIFVLFCLLQHSPVLTENEMDEIDMNLVHVAHVGREPGTTLACNDKAVELKQWADELLKAMQGVARLLDKAHHCKSYTESLEWQQACVLDPEQTTSARMLNEMREHHEGFFHFAKRMSMQHCRYFNSLTLCEERKQLFEQAAIDSHAEQRRIESGDSIEFDLFLKHYFAQ
jgi:glutamate--cysteine ligase